VGRSYAPTLVCNSSTRPSLSTIVSDLQPPDRIAVNAPTTATGKAGAAGRVVELDRRAG
jgi:hypothetical protein